VFPTARSYTLSDSREPARVVGFGRALRGVEVIDEHLATAVVFQRLVARDNSAKLLATQ
jgi:hypothetical protein